MEKWFLELREKLLERGDFGWQWLQRSMQSLLRWERVFSAWYLTFYQCYPLVTSNRGQNIKEDGEHGTLVSLQDRVQQDWEWIPGANERSEVLFPSSFSVTLLNVNRLLKVQDRWTFSTWKRSKSDRQTNPKQVNRGKSEGVDYVVKKNFKKEFRGHMEQTKNQNRHSKINYVIPKICQKGKSDNMKEILETKSVIGQNVPLYLFGLL